MPKMECTQVFNVGVSSDDDSEEEIAVPKRMATLTVDGTVHDIFKGYNKIGSDFGHSAVIINHPSISRHHATIIVSADNASGHKIIDIESTNHTKVNKNRLAPYKEHELKGCDEITFGSVVAKYEICCDDVEQGDTTLVRPGNPVAKLQDSIDVAETEDSSSDSSVIECTQEKPNQFGKTKSQILKTLPEKPVRVSIYDAETQESLNSQNTNLNYGDGDKISESTELKLRLSESFNESQHQSPNASDVSVAQQSRLKPAEGCIIPESPNVSNVSFDRNTNLCSSLTIPKTPQNVMNAYVKLGRPSSSASVKSGRSSINTSVKSHGSSKKTIDTSNESDNDVIHYDEDSDLSDAMSRELSSQCVVAAEQNETQSPNHLYEYKQLENSKQEDTSTNSSINVGRVSENDNSSKDDLGNVHKSDIAGNMSCTRMNENGDSTDSELDDDDFLSAETQIMPVDKYKIDETLPKENQNKNNDSEIETEKNPDVFEIETQQTSNIVEIATLKVPDKLGIAITKLPDAFEIATQKVPDKLHNAPKNIPDLFEIATQIMPESSLKSSENKYLKIPANLSERMPELLEIATLKVPDKSGIAITKLPDAFEIATQQFPDKLHNAPKMIPDLFDIATQILPESSLKTSEKKYIEISAKVSFNEFKNDGHLSRSLADSTKSIELDDMRAETQPVTYKDDGDPSAVSHREGSVSKGPSSNIIDPGFYDQLTQLLPENTLKEVVEQQIPTSPMRIVSKTNKAFAIGRIMPPNDSITDFEEVIEEILFKPLQKDQAIHDCSTLILDGQISNEDIPISEQETQIITDEITIFTTTPVLLDRSEIRSNMEPKPIDFSTPYIQINTDIEKAPQGEATKEGEKTNSETAERNKTETIQTPVRPKRKCTGSLQTEESSSMKSSSKKTKKNNASIVTKPSDIKKNRKIIDMDSDSENDNTNISLENKLRLEFERTKAMEVPDVVFNTSSESEQEKPENTDKELKNGKSRRLGRALKKKNPVVVIKEIRKSSRSVKATQKILDNKELYIMLNRSPTKSISNKTDDASSNETSTQSKHKTTKTKKANQAERESKSVSEKQKVASPVLSSSESDKRTKRNVRNVAKSSTGESIECIQDTGKAVTRRGKKLDDDESASKQINKPTMSTSDSLGLTSPSVNKVESIRETRKRNPTQKVTDRPSLVVTPTKRPMSEIDVGHRKNAKKQKPNSLQTAESKDLKSSQTRNQTTATEFPSEVSPTRVSSRKLKEKVSYKVMFTMIDNAALTDLVTKLGGEIVDNADACTVLVAERVIRTVKFLCCVGKGVPIVSPNWIIKSIRAKKFLDPWKFITKDKIGEAKFMFNLADSLNTSKDTKLFATYTIMGTPSIKPPVTEMKSIIESSGGKFIEVPPKSWPKKSFVVSCDQDKAHWPTKSRSKNSVQIVSSEAIMIGILRQKLELQNYVL